MVGAFVVFPRASQHQAPLMWFVIIKPINFSTFSLFRPYSGAVQCMAGST